ncbi:NAD(P)/FAD-dependent oxidoreductase [Fodinisporobacter ferrooxydans]|uniref:NAD(P)/FAD-dependent oxidoreductase n=1 Tax=Fodinisporobacter ferrooxydans TaxID=2901836 RepID=A0ABY4CNW9_9BACL|nr:NAD(P)/FAD-dependent oxidoreductase [Alicyclobacillaceae bacterium MYW30-H2]
MRRSIVILGGGVGGVITANLLRKKLSDEYEITLIDRETNHVFAPSLLWLMTGDRNAEKISRPLSRLKRKGIEFIQGEIEQIDAQNRTVIVNGENISSDYLIISLGAVLTPEEISGLETGFSFYDLKETERLKQKLWEFQKGRVVVVTASPVYKCPAAPYEAAMLIHAFFQKRGIRPQVTMSFYAAEPAPLAVAGTNVSEGVQQMLRERDISYYPQHQITKVDPDKRELYFANGVHDSYDLLVYVAPHKPPRVVQESGLVGKSGWVTVDRHTLETKIPGVYAIGDVTGIPLELGKPLPKAGVFAHGQAKVIANNIAHKITGEGQQIEFNGHGECFIEIGNNKAGFARGNFYASPAPTVKVHQPGIRWHLGKIAFEKSWFRTWF